MSRTSGCDLRQKEIFVAFGHVFGKRGEALGESAEKSRRKFKTMKYISSARLTVKREKP